MQLMFRRILRYLRKRPALIPILLIVFSVVVWLVTRETLPRTIRVATAEKGGLYAEFGEALRSSLEEKTGRKVEIVHTRGSVENRELLASGDVEVAIIQGGSVAIDDLSVIVPLYPEVVHVVARRGRGIETIADLKGKRVVFGPQGSGMRASADRILEHYSLEGQIVNPTDHYFADLLEEPSIDGAIVTTGLMNRDLQKVLGSGEFDLIPVKGAKAIAVKEPYFELTELPRGLYREGVVIPEEDTSTLATTALLAVRSDEDDLLVDSLMKAIYDGGLELQFPTLISRNDAVDRSPVSLHQVSRIYLNPPDQIGQIAKVMESMVAVKELSVALVAGVYLIWTRRKRLREKRMAEIVQQQKDRLDVYLEQTLEIERAQIKTVDVAELEGFLDRVTEIKLKALDRLTHEELRSDQTFSIFLLQCANLISKIQLKIMIYSPGKPEA